MRRLSVLLTIALLVPQVSLSQERALSVTVTPPLVQLAIGPGESWSSVLKVVNNNPYDVTYYAQVLDFEARGELGKGDIVPVLDTSPEALTHSLASWVSLPAEPIVVPRETSGDVPFTVRVPENAEPGGHYAAILIGTQPNPGSATGSRVAVSSYVTSLLFVRIHGDIDERGRIREFLTPKSLYQSPLADFVLRFENIGNVHLRPEGAITIYNMWGKERGTVEINQRSAFGNVLPKSTRRFEFSWQGEPNPFDIGRYSAEVTLVYGEDLRQNVSATTYFWVIPVMPMLATLGTIFTLLLLLFWFIRRYIRRALQIEGVMQGAVAKPSLQTLMRPISEGAVDLRLLAGGENANATERAPLTFMQFARKYTLFFAFVLLVVACILLGTLFFSTVLENKRDFTITEVSAGADSVAE